MTTYRDKLQIIADILRIASRRPGKTRIMYQANLSYRLLCRYMDELMGSGLISSENGKVYALTDKGKAFLDGHEIYSKNSRRLRERLDYVEKEKAFLESLSCPENPSNSNPRKSARKGGR